MTQDEDKACGQMNRTVPDLVSRLITPIAHQWLAFLVVLALSVLLPLLYFCNVSPASIDPTTALFTYVCVVVLFGIFGLYVHRAECDDVRKERDYLKNDREKLIELLRDMADEKKGQGRDLAPR